MPYPDMTNTNTAIQPNTGNTGFFTTNNQPAPEYVAPTNWETDYLGQNNQAPDMSGSLPMNTNPNNQPIPTNQSSPAPNTITPESAAGFLGDVPPVKDASAYMTPETSMSYQMEKNLAQDSPLMKQAMTQARRGQVAGGMLDSDATAVNVRNNMWNEAKDIAQTDVETARVFGSGQQQADANLSSIGATGQNTINNTFAQGYVTGEQLNQTHANTLTQLADEYGYKWDFQQEQNNFEKDLLDRGLDSQEAISMGNQLSNMVDIALQGMTTTMNTPDQTLTQEMADNWFDTINDFKPYLTSLYGFELAE